MVFDPYLALNHREEDFDLMNQVDLPPIAEFVELVKATDEDADHRLPLVEQAAPVLYAGATISEEEREKLAEKLERWRYQRLNKYSPWLSANDRRLIAVPPSPSTSHTPSRFVHTVRRGE